MNCGYIAPLYDLLRSALQLRRSTTLQKILPCGTIFSRPEALFLSGKGVSEVASAIDVAEHILQSNGPMSGKRLQKLVYYSQAWALAWTELPLFFDRIEAWKDGPVVPELYARHRYSAEVKSVQGDPSSLSKRDRDIVDNVLAFYATRSTQWLIDQTHAERPWQDARRGLMPWHSGRQEITRESIREYYGAKQEKKRVV